jgi:hypothetical protein
MNSAELNSNVAIVKVEGKDLFFDPGSAFTPYGLLPWLETGVTGLKLNKDGGVWVETPLPQSSDSQILRKADLKISDDGAIEGIIGPAAPPAACRTHACVGLQFPTAIARAGVKPSGGTSDRLS